MRIAVVGPVDDGLPAALRQSSPRSEVYVAPSVAYDIDALARFRPELLLVRLGERRYEEVGAVRVLQGMWPSLRVAFLASPGSESSLATIASDIGAHLFLHPEGDEPLGSMISKLLHDDDRSQQRLFVDLAHGLGDEINNPLLFASGHLQLLRSTLPREDRNARDQVDAALDGLGRIRESVDRLLLLSQAAGGPRRSQLVDLADLIGEAVAARPADTAAATVSIAAGPAFVLGDREQLLQAILAVVGFADEVAGLTASCHVELERDAGAHRLGIVARGAPLRAWRPKQSFEPYYPHRALRGHGNGLGLFLAQTVVSGHGGRAAAHWAQDGSLQLGFELPAADGDAEDAGSVDDAGTVKDA